MSKPKQTDAKHQINNDHREQVWPHASCIRLRHQTGMVKGEQIAFTVTIMSCCFGLAIQAKACQFKQYDE